MLWWGGDSTECAKKYLGPVGAWMKELHDAGMLVGQMRLKLDLRFIADMGCLKSVFGRKFCWLCSTTKETSGILWFPPALCSHVGKNVRCCAFGDRPPRTQI